jgi:type I restriction enzyme S subunit
MNRIIQVSKVAQLNLSTYRKDEFPEIVKYLDTSSLTKNKIDGFQILNSNLDIIPSRAQRKVKLNTILFSTVRPNQEHYGIIEKDLEDIVVSTGFTTIDVIDNELNPKYLFYLLTQPHITEYLHTIATNSVSAYPSISPNDLGNLKFRIPELPNQQKIASVLSALDSKIELNNRINAELEAMAKTLYDYWFVQFDFPDKNGKPYKTSGGKMVWNEELKREVPEGWEVKKMFSALKIGSGFPFDSDSYLEAGKFKIITIKNVQELRLETGSVDCTNIIPSNLPEFCKLQIGDILISLTGNVGRICLVTEINLLLNQRVGKFLCSKIYKNFMYLLFQRNEERNRLENIATGSSQKNLSPIDATNVLTLLPSDSILTKFDLLIDPIIDKTIIINKENQKLTELRDWLLPMLMNGQVKVGEGKEVLKAAE